MLGDELRIEQAIAAGFQPRDEMHQRDLGGVARVVKHALAEKGAAERDAIEAADELRAVIDLDGVAMAALEQSAVDAPDTHVDPGAAAVGLRLRAALDDRLE